jgi:hypothetical protein
VVVFLISPSSSTPPTHPHSSYPVTYVCVFIKPGQKCCLGAEPTNLFLLPGASHSFEPVKKLWQKTFKPIHLLFLKMPSSNNIVSLVALLLLVANVYPELVLGNILDQQIPYQRQIRSLANGRWQLR